MANIYATTEALRGELDIDDTIDDTVLDLALGAASRQIDGHTGRRFWQDGSAVAREYYADESRCLSVADGTLDDISTTTGLIVKVDTSADGTFATTLTIGTHFLLLPRNADKGIPVRPWDEIRLTDQTTAWFPQYRDRPGVQVTAKFGWPAIPDDIQKACIVQATQLVKAVSAPFGGVQLGDAGLVMRVRQALNPIAEALCEPYCLARVG